jgi:hypothetical protein
MSTEHEWQTGVGLSNCQVTSARLRHLPPICASCPQHEKAQISSNGKSWSTIVHKALLLSRGRPIQRNYYLRQAAQLDGD